MSMKQTQNTLRLMTESDLPAVMAIQASSYPQRYIEGLATFRSKLKLNPTGCWVACLDQAVRGYLVTVHSDEHHFPSLNVDAVVAPEHPSMLFIHDLALMPDARGQGLSERLLLCALEHARSCALNTIALVAVQGTERFWTRQGFQTCTPRHPVMQQRLASFGADALFMMRAP